MGPVKGDTRSLDCADSSRFRYMVVTLNRGGPQYTMILVKGTPKKYS